MPHRNDLHHATRDPREGYRANTELIAPTALYHPREGTSNAINSEKPRDPRSTVHPIIFHHVDPWLKMT